MNKEKKKIIHGIKRNIPSLYTYDILNNYLNQYPGDTDIIVIKAYLNLIDDNINNRIELLKHVISKSPFNIDAFFLIGQAYNEIGDFFNALINLGKSYNLYIFFNEMHSEYEAPLILFYNHELCSQFCNNILQSVMDNLNTMSLSKKQMTIHMLKDYKKYLDNDFDMFTNIVRSQKEIIGHHFTNDFKNRYFCGFYNPVELGDFVFNYSRNLMLYKLEMIKTYNEGTIVPLKLNTKSLVPVLSLNNNTNLTFNKDNNQSVADIPIFSRMHFNYYKLNEHYTSINANNKIVVGTPVPLVHNPKNKKLVISLFVDGLSQKVIDEYGLKNIMPYTYNFFKNGMKCSNVFTSSDWTLPSISSLISGLTATNHMMIHPAINVKYPATQKLMFEYFKEAGYYTALISGGWRISATYDSIRGIDRYIAKHQNCGFRTEDVLINVIDHIETFKEADQYIWVGTADLHDIADEFCLPSAIQAKMDLEEFQIGKKSVTSVKQTFNPNKISTYVKTATHIDSKLKALYEYIENNYSDDEFVVTLFGDHGQAYIIPPNDHHLSRGLSNICFLTRGGGFSGTSDEYISITDYTNIITKLSGITNAEINSDGILPKTFGGIKEHEFVITETLHPGDPYMIALHNQEYTFFLTTETNVTQYGKVDLTSYSTMLIDSYGKKITNIDLENKFINYISEYTKYIQIY